MRLRQLIGGVLAAVFAFALAFAAMAQSDAAEAKPDSPFVAWENQSVSARQVIDAGAASPEALEAMQDRLTAQQRETRALSQRAGEDISRIEEELTALGPPPEEGVEEAAEAAALRAELNQKLAEAKALQGRAQVANRQTIGLLRDLAALGQRRLVDNLLARGPSPLNPANWIVAFEEIVDAFSKVEREIVRALEAPSERQLFVDRAPLAVIAVIASLFIFFGVRGFALGFLLKRADHKASRGRRLVMAIGVLVARALIVGIAAAFVLFGISSLGVLGVVGTAVLTGVAHGVGTLIIAYVLASAIFSPASADIRLPKISDAAAHSAFRASMGLALIVMLSRILNETADAVDASDAARGIYSFITASLGGLALLRAARALRLTAPVEGGDTQISLQAFEVLRRSALVVAFLTPVLALAGYAFAASFIAFPFVRSLAVIAAGYLIFATIREAVDIYLAGDDGKGDRFRLIPILVGFLLICAALPILALVWRARVSDLWAAYETISEGVTIGDVAISPFDFIAFAMVFAVGYTITRLIQRVLANSVLPKTGVSEGGATAVVSGVGYVGVFIAALAAITATGIDLSSLAIVFGALSVGIGFGLQNIVSNFVSGVILLIERPIKVGDWIDVGGAQGYVRKVNVRSTEIETFDRASYIVPNSDLISAPVLNWTHSNKTGRVRVPVGVAYGTDVRKIEAILLEVGNEHPMVVANPAPGAYFMGFGADSLNFELRVYLRDVNWMLSVTSDLNYRIVERFTEEGIEIPFAQRDINIRNPEALGRALMAPLAPSDDGREA